MEKSSRRLISAQSQKRKPVSIQSIQTTKDVPNNDSGSDRNFFKRRDRFSVSVADLKLSHKTAYCLESIAEFNGLVKKAKSTGDFRKAKSTGDFHSPKIRSARNSPVGPRKSYLAKPRLSMPIIFSGAWQPNHQFSVEEESEEETSDCEQEMRKSKSTGHLTDLPPLNSSLSLTQSYTLNKDVKKDAEKLANVDRIVSKVFESPVAPIETLTPDRARRQRRSLDIEKSDKENLLCARKSKSLENVEESGVNSQSSSKYHKKRWSDHWHDVREQFLGKSPGKSSMLPRIRKKGSKEHGVKENLQGEESLEERLHLIEQTHGIVHRLSLI